MNENIRKGSFLVPSAAKSADTRSAPLFCAKKHRLEPVLSIIPYLPEVLRWCTRPAHHPILPVHW